MNQIHVPRRLLLRRQFLKPSGFSSMSFLLGGCGLPVFEGVVGKISEPLNQKVETFRYFNWIWRHSSLGSTAAQRAELTNRPWSWNDIATYPTLC